MGKVLIDISDEDLEFLKTHYLKDNRTGEIHTTDKFIEPIRNGISLSDKYILGKDQYETRLKADLEAILVELKLEIHELENPYPHDYDNILPLAQHNAFYDAQSTIEDLVDEKINALGG